MIWITQKLRAVVLVSILMSLPVMSGCEGSESRDKVDSTVETLTGKEKVDRMKKMTEDIDGIKAVQKERLQQTQKE